MYTYTFGGKNGKKNTLHESNDRVVVRTKNARNLSDAVFSAEGKKVMLDFSVEVEFPDADVTVLKMHKKVRDVREVRDNARTALKNEPELRFAGRVLVDADDKTPVLYTENIFIKFYDNVTTETCEKILSDHNLVIKQKPEYAVNSYFVSAPENTGLQVFELAESLLSLNAVEFCHPELIRKRGRKVIHPNQWHLRNSTVNGVSVNAGVMAEQAHVLSTGKDIVVAIIDDGFDIDHAEFNKPGKVVHSRDVTLNTNDPRPRYAGDNHGTSCAGVAVASGIKASGVAPDAVFMPIRLYSELGSYAESTAFKWASDHGASVISCSWGPEDGAWNDPGDPTHTIMVDLPDSTRLAMDYAISSGRNGKGCVILFAAGNGNEDVKYDGYASYNKVMAISACNDTGKKSVYSDFGSSVWCTFPSSDFGYAPFNHPNPVTPGIYTTDRSGAAGYNKSGDYTGDFGGTSSACPGVAGIVALVLSANPDLTWQQVREVLKETAEKIDTPNGGYDTQGHSNYYGFGRVNAEAAVKKALTLKTNNQSVTVKVISALVNPSGFDYGRERISILNTLATDVDVNGWSLEVNGRKETISGRLRGGEARTINLGGSGVRLTNSGATINLLNAQAKLVHTVAYQKKQVKKGVVVEF